MSLPPLPRTGVPFSQRPDSTPCGLRIILGVPVWYHVETGCRVFAADFGKTGLDHFDVDILAVQQKDLTEGPSVPISSIRFHVDDLAQNKSGKVLGRLPGKRLSIPPVGTRGYWSINSDQYDGDLDAPMRNDEGMPVDYARDLVLAAK